MKLYQYLFVVDLLKTDYQKEKATITNSHQEIFLEFDYGLIAKLIERKLSSNNNGDSTFQFITGSLIFPYKMDNGKEVNSVEEMFFALCKGEDK